MPLEPMVPAVVAAAAAGVGMWWFNGPRGVRWIRYVLLTLALLGVTTFFVGAPTVVTGLRPEVAVALGVGLAALGAAIVEQQGRRLGAVAVVAVAAIVTTALLVLPTQAALVLAAVGWPVLCLTLAVGFRRAMAHHPGSLLDARLHAVALALWSLAFVGVAPVAGRATELVAGLALVGGGVLLWFAVSPPPGVQLTLRPMVDLLRTVDRELSRSADPDRSLGGLMSGIASLFGAQAVVLTDGGRPIADHGVQPDLGLADAAVERAEELDGEGLLPHVLVPVEDRWVLVVPTGRGRLAAVLDEVGLLLADDDRDRLSAIATRIGVALDRADAQRRDRVAVSSMRAIDRMRDDFLATLSHELRTPLTSIRGFSEVLLEHGIRLDAARRRDLLQRVVDKSGQLEEMIAGLLELTAVRGRSEPERIARYDLHDLAQRAIGRARSRLGERSVEVSVPEGEVVTDGGAVLAVLDHLLDNVAKFTPPATSVRLVGRLDDDVAELVVLDDGPGVGGVKSSRLFEPFVRGGDVLTRETRGVGIGLAIARELATQLGGTLSSLDVTTGSAFVLRVARRMPGAGAGSPATAADAEQLAGDVLPRSSSVAPERRAVARPVS